MTNFMTSLKGALLVGTIAGAVTLCLSTRPARAQIVIIPPSGCVATMSPVYYEGNAAYWCGDSWYYRNGGGWGRYGTEPGYLRSYRGSHAAGREFYGRGRAWGGARAGGGGDGHRGGTRGGGGEHGGGHGGGGGRR
jgi:hypothetical protein